MVRSLAKDTSRDLLSYAVTNDAPRCLFILIVLTLNMGSGQGLASDLAERRNISFDHLDTSDGLSHAGVNFLLQDRHGFIWIGTQEGLNRYDGYRFETFYHNSDDPKSLSNDFVTGLLEDRNGILWVTTEDGLNRFNPRDRSFQRIVHEVDSHPGVHHEVGRRLYEDRSGHLWTGSDAGLCRMEADGSFTHFVHEAGNPQSIARGLVRAIFEDSKGRFWTGTLGGLSVLDRDTDTFFRYTHDPYDPQSLADNYVRFIFEADDGLLWIGTYSGGISILDPDVGTFTHLQHDPNEASSLASNRVRAILQDNQQSIWIATSVGIDLWQPSTRSFQHFSVGSSDTDSSSATEVYDLYQDDGSVIWAGTPNGISKWNAKVPYFPHIRHQAGDPDSLFSDSVISFAEGVPGIIWIGTAEGLSRWDTKNGRFSHIKKGERGLSGNQVMSLLFDSLGRLWVGTINDGLNLLLPGSSNFQVFRHDGSNSDTLSTNAIIKILEDSAGNIWVSTDRGGLNLYRDDGTFLRYPLSRKPGDDFGELMVLDIVEDDEGTMWLATDGSGVIRLDPATGRTSLFQHQPQNPDSLSSDSPITLLKTADSVWLGTKNEGLNRYSVETGSFTRYRKKDGLASNAVYGLLEDDYGRIWISGGHGLSVLDIHSNQVFVFDTTHGLQNEDFTHGAFLKSSSGTFLFGGYNGFNAFNPLDMRGNSHVPPIKLTRFTKFNENFDMDVPPYEIKTLQLDHSDYVIGFEFAAMDFTAPQNNAYRYMLEGFDRDWVEVTDVHQATYTNLPANDYIFRVLGSNNDGVWNNEGLTIDINVSPPIWETWWAYTVYLMVAVGLVYWLQRAQADKSRREAEKRYNERLQLYIESLEEASDCVLIADANQQLMYVNNAISALMGMEPVSATGQPMMDLLFYSDRDAANAAKALTTDGRWHGEVDNQRGEEQYTAEMTLATVKSPEDVTIAYVGIARDITERKLTEAELARYRRNLEQLVSERTEALSREVVEHKSARENLASSLQEKELLLKEVHHRVKNNMQVISSLLNIQAETVEDNRFMSLLNESQQRIKSMAMIHENLYQSESLVEIDFHDYIQSLANSLCRSYSTPGMTIHLDIRVDDINLDIDTAVPCGLIINELISNALKHAYCDRVGDGTIGIHFIKSPDAYELSICDDGRGMPTDFDFSNAQSMGMEIVCILTEQLEGEIQFRRDKGSNFTVTFPGR